MIVSKCPLRISLAGGSSDLEDFIAQNSYGAVISFPADVYVYATLFSDKNGFNKNLNNYIISYSSEEKSKSVKNIKNDVVREALVAIPTPPLKISLCSDIFSEGSGLAASSAYTVALVKGLHSFNSKRVSNSSACEQALKIERNFNPLTGRQDPYGCGIGGLKKLEFFPNNTLSFQHEDSILNNFSMSLLYTGIKRKSTRVLKTINLKKVDALLDSVIELEQAITNKNIDDFCGIINSGWAKKKKTSSLIQDNPEIKFLDAKLKREKKVKAHRLCGAGGGGYFLVLTDKNENLKDLLPQHSKSILPIKLDKKGATITKL